MVNRNVIIRRIQKAQEYLDFLKQIKNEYNLKEFKSDPKVYGSSERFLHLAIEALMDIGNHIIADENLGKVEYYSDIPKILYENKYIGEELRDVFIKIIGFRNILVHDYIDINLDLVFEVIDKNLTDIEEIIKEYGKLI
ncbi:type VII toxin-antitoxin system HepT family RNase toxin [Thermohalobacter berrensis]|uniref:DUF86 domain-containing protein n=1 Tax=Thermohalobacter berrensis TaxID=99594 RepID=A0A419T4E4_9FIRM|nr:DUF86 domain-containing protein [Thermohalobacter berrensis]RKD32296.1 hypothetical protein BET03_03015 [Thermohalobacter berrensis]